MYTVLFANKGLHAGFVNATVDSELCYQCGGVRLRAVIGKQGVKIAGKRRALAITESKN